VSSSPIPCWITLQTRPGLSVGFECLLLLYYVALAVVPIKWWYRRPALFWYAVALALYSVFYVARCIVIFVDQDDDVDDDMGGQGGGGSDDGGSDDQQLDNDGDDTNAFKVFNIVIVVLSTVGQPLATYWVLLFDSMWWQGVYYQPALDASSQHTGTSTNSEPGSDPSPSHSVDELGRGKYHLNSPLLGEGSVWDAFGRRTCTTLAACVEEAGDRVIPFGQLTLLRKLHVSSGSSARVFCGRIEGLDQVLAVKMLYLVELGPHDIQDFCAEAARHAQLTHPNIIATCGVCVMPPAICLIMEYAENGSLFNYLRKPEGLLLTWRQRLGMCVDAVRGVAFLHDHHQVIHCDLKSPNFLVDDALVLKQCDLGASQSLNHPHERRSIPEPNRSSAPELVTDPDGHSKETDVYALALVCYEILTGGEAFHEHLHMNLGTFHSHLVAKEIKLHVPVEIRKRSPQIAEVLELSTSYVASDRPTAAAIELVLSRELTVQEEDPGIFAAHGPSSAIKAI
jgi:hypothetical protein